jgi:predicted ATPase
MIQVAFLRFRGLAAPVAAERAVSERAELRSRARRRFAGELGKTRLAMRIAEASAPDYHDGVWFVGFSDVTDADLIAPTICQTLGLADQAGVTPVQRRSVSRASSSTRCLCWIARPLSSCTAPARGRSNPGSASTTTTRSRARSVSGLMIYRLAVFAGGCTLAAAESVCDADLDTLQALTDRSLVSAEHGRYRMLQTLREYALGRLDQAAETGEVRRRHVTWCAELLEGGIVDGYLQATPSNPAQLAFEGENFHGALERAAEHGESETVARIAAPLTPWVWSRHGQLNEADRSTALLNLTHIANAQRRHGDAAALGRKASPSRLTRRTRLPRQR